MIMLQDIDQLERLEAVAKAMGDQMYTSGQREQWAKLIKSFNKLWYMHDRQTWCTVQWKGVNILKPPTDLWVYQELIFKLQPQLIIEAGTHRGGSALWMDDVCQMMNPGGKVMTIDVDDSRIDPRAREGGKIDFIKGDSTSDEVKQIITDYIKAHDVVKIMVVLDSDHSYEHVTKELNLYSQFLNKGCALIVEDTTQLEETAKAVSDWLADNPDFSVDEYCEKYMLTFNRGGYLERSS